MIGIYWGLLVEVESAGLNGSPREDFLKTIKAALALMVFC